MEGTDKKVVKHEVTYILFMVDRIPRIRYLSTGSVK